MKIGRAIGNLSKFLLPAYLTRLIAKINSALRPLTVVSLWIGSDEAEFGLPHGS